MLYLFFCKDCWRKKNDIIVFKQQLPEISDYFNGEELINPEKHKNSQLYNKLNQITNQLLPEYFIETYPEKKEATLIYNNFYYKIQETSKSNLSNVEDDDDDDYDYENINDKNIKNLLDQYLKENNLTLDLIKEDVEDEKESNNKDKDFIVELDDIFYDTFDKVTLFNPSQILRFNRDNVIPLWFCKFGLLATRDLKCKFCSSKMVFEFQVMPYIFNVYQEIQNIDIGTILIYTCEKSCDKSFREFGYIQRTGETVFDLNNKNKVISQNTKIPNYITKIEEINNLAEELSKTSLKNKNEPDEDGFVEVKNKRKPRKQEKEEDLDKDYEKDEERN